MSSHKTHTTTTQPPEWEEVSEGENPEGTYEDVAPEEKVEGENPEGTYEDVAPEQTDEVPAVMAVSVPTMPPPPGVPTAVYDNPTLKLMARAPVGTRGYGGKHETLTTNTGVANTDLVIRARDPSYANDLPIKVQYAIVAPGALPFLYQDGIPSKLVSTQGFTLVSKSVGRFANLLTLTLVDNGAKACPLIIQRPGLNDIVIQLAKAASAITTTTAQLITALASDPEISSMVIPVASGASVTLVAAPKTYFTGGADVPRLVYVSLGNAAGVSNTTGATVQGMLRGSRLVTAAPSGASTGAGSVPVMAATPLTAGVPSRGAVSDSLRAERDFRDKVLKRGNPIGKERQQTVQVRSSRLGTPRTYQRVPRQDRAIIASSPINYQQERGPQMMEWF